MAEVEKCAWCGHPLTDKHQASFQELKGIRRVVINNQYGGFGLTYQAQIEYLTRAGVEYQLKDREDRHSNLTHGPYIVLPNGEHWNHKQVERDDPVLVELVQEWGQKAASDFCHFKIVKIPGDVSWIIDEYDGLEWVAEQHRKWS